jgi:hypothetical protein
MAGHPGRLTVYERTAGDSAVSLELLAKSPDCGGKPETLEHRGVQIVHHPADFGLDAPQYCLRALQGFSGGFQLTELDPPLS